MNFAESIGECVSFFAVFFPEHFECVCDEFCKRGLTDKTAQRIYGHYAVKAFYFVDGLENGVYDCRFPLLQFAEKAVCFFLGKCGAVIRLIEKYRFESSALFVETVRKRHDETFGFSAFGLRDSLNFSFE